MIITPVKTLILLHNSQTKGMYNNDLRSNQDVQLETERKSYSKKASINNYIAYLPNFRAKAHRDYSSSKTVLMEKSGDFLISKTNDIPCPACGKKMLNLKKFQEISEELATAQNEQYLEILKQYTSYMRPVELSVFNEIYALSKNKGASKDIRTLLVSLRDKKLPILQEVQMKQVNKMTTLAKRLPKSERVVLLKKIKKLKTYIHRTNSEAPFRRKILIDRISKIKIKNPLHYQKLQIIAKNFPSSYDINSAWIVKYSGKNKQNEDWSSYDIACRFLYSSIANTDHILAYNLEKNHDDISNYLAMHSACNSQKSDKSFLHWIYEDKENRIQFLQNYFKEVETFLSKKAPENPKYKDYVPLAKETIRTTTSGKVNL